MGSPLLDSGPQRRPTAGVCWNPTGSSHDSVRHQGGSLTVSTVGRVVRRVLCQTRRPCRPPASIISFPQIQHSLVTATLPLQPFTFRCPRPLLRSRASGYSSLIAELQQASFTCLKVSPSTLNNSLRGSTSHHSDTASNGLCLAHASQGHLPSSLSDTRSSFRTTRIILPKHSTGSRIIHPCIVTDHSTSSRVIS